MSVVPAFPARAEWLIVSGAAAILALRCVLALAIIPPWQQPDEPTHVASVEAQISRLVQDRTEDPGREADILWSMRRYDWWEHRRAGLPPSQTIPTSRGFQAFAEAGNLPVGVPAPAGTLPLYAVITGHLLSWFPRGEVVDDLRWLRLFSALAGLGTLWAAWAGARECLGAVGGATVAVLLALHPQFVSVATAAAPDAAVNLAGACVWWQAMIAVRRMRRLALLGMWTAAILATSLDRMGVPLLAFALCVSGVVAFARVRSAGWGSMLIAATAAAAGLAVAVWARVSFTTTTDFAGIFSGGLAPVPAVMTWPSFAHFNWSTFQGWWLWLGWARYAPPLWWFGIVAALTIVAAGGTARLLAISQLEAITRRLLLLAAIGIAIQLAAVYWAYFRLDIGGQGKYLFPFIVPSLTLLWSGVDAWVPRSRHIQAAGALILLFAMLDAVGWGMVAIPAYYASH